MKQLLKKAEKSAELVLITVETLYRRGMAAIVKSLQCLKDKLHESAKTNNGFIRLASEVGEFGVGAVISVTVGIVVIGAILVALWPTITGTNTSVQAMTQSDAGTTTLKALWPIAIIVIGIGVAAGVVIWACEKFGLMH